MFEIALFVIQMVFGLMLGIAGTILIFAGLVITMIMLGGMINGFRS